MDDKTKQELALFRFSLIAPLVNGTAGRPAKEYIEEVCSRRYDVPGLGVREFSPSTLRGWLSSYNKSGLDGLIKKTRDDDGKFRSISPEAKMLIDEVLKANPTKTALNVYQSLLASRLPDAPSLSTVQRYVKQVRSALSEPQVERRRFECQYANDCWQSDAMQGPYILEDGRKRETHLLIFLDDTSRLVVDSRYFFVENYLALEKLLYQALLKRGIPKKIFCDNGKIFHSTQLSLICARLGIALSFARPYSPESKGKVERYFRTHQEQFLKDLDIHKITSLDQLNQLNAAYTEGTYNLRKHSALNGLSPMERFMRDQERLRFVSRDRLDQAFLHEEKRRVSKDATVSLGKTFYEVPQIYCGLRVVILFSPHDPSCVYLKPPDGGELIRIQPVRPVDNSMIPRKQNLRDPLDYTKLYEGGK